MNNSDPTEDIRREMVAYINAQATDSKEADRKRLAEQYGEYNVWDTAQLGATFEVKSFAAPFCIVRHRASGKMGTVEFQHDPRLYFNFQVS